MLATRYRARGPDVLEEGRLGGVSWGMGRGAAPPAPVIAPPTRVLASADAAIPRWLTPVRCRGGSVGGDRGLADADAAVVRRDLLVDEHAETGCG